MSETKLTENYLKFNFNVKRIYGGAQRRIFFESSLDERPQPLIRHVLQAIGNRDVALGATSGLFFPEF